MQSRPSFETTWSAGSNGTQAVVETDAWLPYQRPKGTDLESMRAELELLEKQETASTARSSATLSSTSTVRPSDSSNGSNPSSGSPDKERSDSSKSSDPSSGSPDKERSRPFTSRTNTAESQPWPLRDRVTPPVIPEKNPARTLLGSYSPPRDARRMRLDAASPSTDMLQPVKTNDRSAHRIQQQVASGRNDTGSQQPVPNDRPASRSQQQTPYDRARPQQQIAYDRVAPKVQQPQPVANFSQPRVRRYSLPKRPSTANARDRDLADTLSSLNARPAPRAQSRPRKPPSVHSVQYETVEGVNLKTRPKSAKDNRTGLSIPEIEARDIRQIDDRSPENEDGEYAESEYSGSSAHYARYPPPVGAVDHVRSISPKPVVDGEDHIFFDRYSRAADDEMPDQRAAIPHRYRQSIVAPFTKQLTPQPEEEEDAQSTYSGAEPPSVARTKAFEAQDAEMNSRTSQAKKLVTGLLKGFTSKKDQDESRLAKNEPVTRDFGAMATDEQIIDHDRHYGHGRGRDQIHELEQGHDRVHELDSYQDGHYQNRTSYLHSDSDEADVQHEQGIWSPTHMSRSSFDTVIMRGGTPDVATAR